MSRGMERQSHPSPRSTSPSPTLEADPPPPPPPRVVAMAARTAPHRHGTPTTPPLAGLIGSVGLVPSVGSRRADAPRPGAAWGRQAPTAPDRDSAGGRVASRSHVIFG
jgi:hypothetical protein